MHLENVAGAIGMPLDVTMIEAFADSGRIGALATQDVTWLGVKILLQDAGTGYATLVLRRADVLNFSERLSEVYVGIDLRDRTVFDRLWEIVKLAEPRVVSGYRGILELYKPAGDTWHVTLFRRFCAPPFPPFPALFDASLATTLAPHRRFRHVALHSYGSQLEWSRMAEGVAGVEELFSQIKIQLADYLLTIDAL